MTVNYGPAIAELANPLDLFADWLSAAENAEPNDPNAMCLATVGKDGQPSARMVLMKEYSGAGLVFYTNTQSHKGRQLAQNSKAALLFHWKSLRRQIRFEGSVVPVSAQEADAYFASRPRDARIGAWASDQSRPLSGRNELEQSVAAMSRRFEGQEVARPKHWSGYRLQPLVIEFWQEQAFRLHDRVVYTRDTIQAEWTHARLYP